MISGWLTVIGLVCLVSGLLDLGMNGRYSDWAPFGIGGAALLGFTVWMIQ